MLVFVVFGLEGLSPIGSGMCLMVGRMMRMELCSFCPLLRGEESLVW